MKSITADRKIFAACVLALFVFVQCAASFCLVSVSFPGALSGENNAISAACQVFAGPCAVRKTSSLQKISALLKGSHISVISSGGETVSCERFAAAYIAVFSCLSSVSRSSVILRL